MKNTNININTKQNNCIFCDITHENQNILHESEKFFVIKDSSPVNNGHVLVISKRHIENIFELNSLEWIELQEVVNNTKDILDKKFNPDGYNIGINCGLSAGQTVFHLHIHIIPRYIGDVENPRGGIRNFKKPIKEY